MPAPPASISRTSWPRRRNAAISAARCWCRSRQHIRTLNAARLAADVEGVPTVLLCRTDAEIRRSC